MNIFGTNEELISKIETGLTKCKKEKLSLNDYEELLNQTRELHERVLIIRHKAAEILAGQQAQQGLEQAPIIHHTKEIQAEETKEEVNFSFSLFEEEIPTQTEKKEEIKSETTASAEVETPQTFLQDQDKKDDPFAVKNEKNALVDKLSVEKPNDLAASLQKSPISSIVDAISLNDRIKLVKNLFQGNADLFNVSIKELDGFETLQAAENKMRELENGQHWDTASNDYLFLKQLVERRYLKA